SASTEISTLSLHDALPICIYGQGDYRQHGDLAHGVEAAEIDQQHVDDIGAATAFAGIGQEELPDALALRSHQHGIAEHCDPESAGDRDQHVARTAQPDMAWNPDIEV